MRYAGKYELPQAVWANMLAGGRLDHAATPNTPTRKHDVEDGATGGTRAIFNFDQEGHREEFI
jgi:hypothetical protein